MNEFKRPFKSSQRLQRDCNVCNSLLFAVIECCALKLALLSLDSFKHLCFVGGKNRISKQECQPSPVSRAPGNPGSVLYFESCRDWSVSCRSVLSTGLLVGLGLSSFHACVSHECASLPNRKLRVQAFPQQLVIFDGGKRIPSCSWTLLLRHRIYCTSLSCLHCTMVLVKLKINTMK